MRPSLTILLILFSIAAFSQQYSPVGIANSYTLTEADGYPGSNYVSGFEYSPSGKVYAKDFFGNLHITGNNFIRHVPGVENITNNTMLKIGRQGNEIWLIDENQHISVIRNDSLWKKIIFPDKNPIGVESFGDQENLMSFVIRNNMLVCYRLTGDAWQRYCQAPFPHAYQFNRLFGYFMKNGGLQILGKINSGDWVVYKLNPSRSRLDSVTTISPYTFWLNASGLCDSNWKENKPLINALVDFANRRSSKNETFTINRFDDHFQDMFPLSPFIFSYANNRYEYLDIENGHVNHKTIVFESKDKLNGTRTNPSYPYLTVLTGNKPFRLFPYVKKYPRIFDDDNASNIFALAQDDSGRIWAGSYQNDLTIIDDPLPPNQRHDIIRLKKQPYPFMNASFNHKGKIYLVGESDEGGILRYDMKGMMTKSLPQMPTAYYLYMAPRSQTIYYPTAGSGYPVYYCKAEELERSLVPWKKLDSTAGIAPFGMTSITEDTLGRIWMGHPKKGFAVYDPAIGKGISYKTHDHETPIGFVSSITDKHGTVWMGTDNRGLWYYDDYHKTATPANIHQASHPLLNTIPRITSMSIYNGWLVLGGYNKICLLNLDSFYQKKKVIVRYLNPQESNFTSFTEQNTMLVSKRDSSLWFATSDMLYRWDINTWLHLPVYKVNVNTYLQYDSNQIALIPQNAVQLSPQVHGFDVFFEYLSPDGLPRYTRAALVQQGDSIVFPEPGMQSRYSYKSLSSGSYIFYLEIFEQDGGTTRYQYPFSIDRYYWQHWWFWAAVTFLFLLPFALWLNARRKQALQQKKISQMNLITLSSQFRPHFILNALNAIGADLKDNPGAESIISRLGESISLIFNYAQQRRVSHSLKDEWSLVQNVIEIHRIIYLPELNFSFHDHQILEKYKETEVPLGILEIHVENALLHGLRNKRTPPYNLRIEIDEDDTHLYFTISDNGIGRHEAMSISSYKKNGVGTKNINDIINSLNRYNKQKIKILYADLEQGSLPGTRITISIPKKYHYKY